MHSPHVLMYISLNLVISCDIFATLEHVLVRDTNREAPESTNHVPLIIAN